MAGDENAHSYGVHSSGTEYTISLRYKESASPILGIWGNSKRLFLLLISPRSPDDQGRGRMRASIVGLATSASKTFDTTTTYQS